MKTNRDPGAAKYQASLQTFLRKKAPATAKDPAEQPEAEPAGAENPAPKPKRTKPTVSRAAGTSSRGR